MVGIPLDLLLPDLTGLQLSNFAANPQLITLELTSNSAVAYCPLCKQPTRQIHSRYLRQVEDLPWKSIPVLLKLKLRRFWCLNGLCLRKIFVERLSPAINAYARRTTALIHRITDLAFELGGQAAAFICSKLAMAASASTLIRYIRQAPEGVQQTPLLKNIGVDDWAIRRGQTYGTIIVDLDRHRPVALLPDRTKETLVKWLEQHPEVEVISRDRASAYSQAADLAAPQAIQVADKFHLLQNLSEKVMRVLQGHNQELQVVATRLAQLEKAKAKAKAKAKENPKLCDEAVGIDIIPTSIPGNHDPIVGEMKAEVGLQTQEDKQAKAKSIQIGKDLAALSLSEVEVEVEVEKAKTRKLALGSPQNQFEQVKKLAQQGYSYRAIAKHLGLDRRTARKYHLAQELPQRGVGKFDNWLVEAEESGIKEFKVFAQSLRGDYKAVRAGIELEISNGQTEGQVNRLKWLKRAMFGRAKFDLLRRRVLYHRAA